MKRVYQTKFGEKEGNCFQAAVASLFELEIDEVPDFGAATSWSWMSRFQEWTQEQFGLTPLAIDIMNDNHSYMPDGYYLLAGKSPRGDCLHQCIGLNGEIAHDPHPSGDGLADYQEILVFVKHFPAIEKVEAN